MYAVVGSWHTDPGLATMRGEMLDRLVEGVRATPGFVQGYWADSAPTRSHTFIVFADRASAEIFAEDVRGNLENQARAGVRNEELDIAQVVASA